VMRLRTMSLALFAALSLLGEPGVAGAQLIPPPSRDAWPRGVPVPKITPPQALDLEVAGGDPSPDHKVVGIVTFDSAGKPSVCSGVLLTKDIVLTAAHCTCNIVRYGVTNDQKIAEARWRPATVLSIFDRYDCALGPYGGNDLAMLKATDAKLANGRGGPISDDYSIVDTIALSARWIRSPPLRLRVEGYGYDGVSAASLGGRRTALIELDSAACLEVEVDWTGCSVFFEFILGMRLTAGTRRDSCAGDSGGPVFSAGGDRPFLVGVVSRGVPGQHPLSVGACGRGGIYTHIGRHDVIRWIKRHTAR
jgi:hypothetical protein